MLLEGKEAMLSVAAYLQLEIMKRFRDLVRGRLISVSYIYIYI